MTVQPISVSVTIGSETFSAQMVGDPHDFAVVTACSNAVTTALVGWRPES